MFARLLLFAVASSLATVYFLRTAFELGREPETRGRRVFAGLCVALAFWSFGAALLPSASDGYLSFWFRVSALGWTLAPPLTLHFLMRFAQRSDLLARRWLIFSIYAPGAFFCLAAWSGAWEPAGDLFRPSAWGAVYAPDAVVPLAPFLLAYALATVGWGLWIVHRRGRDAELIARRLQARVIVVAGAAALLLLVVWGWIGLALGLPQMGHLFAALWVLAVRHAISRHRLLLSTPAVVAQDILRTISDAVILLDRDRRVMGINHAGERLLGVSQSAGRGIPVESILGGEDSEAAKLVVGLLDSEDFVDSDPDGIEVEIDNRQGGRTPLLASFSRLRDEHGQTVGTVLILRDITNQKKVEAQLRFTATHDPLTGLPNRSLLDDRLDQAAERAERTDKLFAVLLFDLDDFKDVNDSYGHAAGDTVLQEVARRLQHAVRGVDTVCRLGGDEFLLVLEDLHGAEEVDLVLERNLRSIQKPISIGDHSVVCTASIGVSLFPDHAEGADALLRKADLALYSAKRGGKGLSQVFLPDMEEANRSRIAIERALRGAVVNDELVLEYQPMVSLRRRQVTAVEALVRWDSPELGLQQPNDFIPVAERIGMIVPIGEWVLRAACRQTVRWQRDGHPKLPVAVNVSVKQIQEPDFFHLVTSVLEETGLEPSCLELELTESVALQSVEHSAELLSRLGELGVRIVIDDFGTGYSSMARLRQLYMHAVKIDRDFIRHIATRSKDRALVSTLVKMAEKLDIEVIAEGVETEEQCTLLQSIHGGQAGTRDFRRMQGFLFSRPVAADEIPALLRPQPPRAD